MSIGARLRSRRRRRRCSATLSIPAGVRLIAVVLAASPLLHVAALLAHQRFLGFGDPSPWGYIVNMGAAPIVAGLLLRRHWRARFSLYVLFSCQAFRGIHDANMMWLGATVLGLVYFQLPSVVRAYPRVDSRRILRRHFPERALDPSEPKSAGDVPKLRHGFLGGILGGLAFALMMIVNGTMSELGMMTLPLIGSLVGHPSIWIGFAVHMLNSAVIGASYVLFFGRIERGMIDGFHYGMLYGLIWWFIGPLTLMPLLLGLEVGSQWTLANVLRTLPSLIGHLVYGAILGMTVGWFHDESLPVGRPAVQSRTPAGIPETSRAPGGPPPEA